MHYKRNFLIGGLAAVLVTAAVLGFVFGMAQDQAQTKAQKVQTQSPKDVSFDFFGRVAEILGVEKEQLTNAITQARDERIDQLVEEGWLGEKQAELIKARTERDFGHFGRLGFFGCRKDPGYPGNPGRRGGW